MQCKRMDVCLKIDAVMSQDIDAWLTCESIKQTCVLCQLDKEYDANNGKAELCQ